jgi:ABC-type dipeptide/oligopeptide/nickel transport system permease component
MAEGFWGFLHRLLLPALTLSVVFIALIWRA